MEIYIAIIRMTNIKIKIFILTLVLLFSCDKSGTIVSLIDNKKIIENENIMIQNMSNAFVNKNDLFIINNRNEIIKILENNHLKLIFKVKREWILKKHSMFIEYYKGIIDFEKKTDELTKDDYTVSINQIQFDGKLIKVAFSFQFYIHALYMNQKATSFAFFQDIITFNSNTFNEISDQIIPTYPITNYDNIDINKNFPAATDGFYFDNDTIYVKNNSAVSENTSIIYKLNKRKINSKPLLDYNDFNEMLMDIYPDIDLYRNKKLILNDFHFVKRKDKELFFTDGKNIYNILRYHYKYLFL